MMRTVCTKDAIAKTFDGLSAIAGETFQKQMGVSVFIEKSSVSTEISLQSQLLFLLICAIIAIVVSALISRHRRLQDR